MTDLTAFTKSALEAIINAANGLPAYVVRRQSSKAVAIARIGRMAAARGVTVAAFVAGPAANHGGLPSAAQVAAFAWAGCLDSAVEEIDRPAVVERLPEFAGTGEEIELPSAHAPSAAAGARAARLAAARAGVAERRAARPAKAERPLKAERGAPRAGSKLEVVTQLMSRPEGATQAELVAATGWRRCLGTQQIIARRTGRTLEVRRDAAGVRVYHLAA